MYNETPQQTAALYIQEKHGFQFSNWISAQESDPNLGVMVLVRRKRGTTHYREINPDGSIN